MAYVFTRGVYHVLQLAWVHVEISLRCPLCGFAAHSWPVAFSNTRGFDRRENLRYAGQPLAGVMNGAAEMLKVVSRTLMAPPRDTAQQWATTFAIGDYPPAAPHRATANLLDFPSPAERCAA